MKSPPEIIIALSLFPEGSWTVPYAKHFKSIYIMFRLCSSGCKFSISYKWKLVSEISCSHFSVYSDVCLRALCCWKIYGQALISWQKQQGFWTEIILVLSRIHDLHNLQPQNGSKALKVHLCILQLVSGTFLFVQYTIFWWCAAKQNWSSSLGEQKIYLIILYLSFIIIINIICEVLAVIINCRTVLKVKIFWLKTECAIFIFDHF